MIPSQTTVADPTVPPKRVAVFGAGQIGTFAVRALLEAGHRVLAADIAPENSFVRRFGGYGGDVVRADLCDGKGLRELLERSGQFDAVVSAAGMTSALAVADPSGARRVAVDGTVALLDAAEKAGVRRVVLVSSLAVYGQADDKGGYLDEVAADLTPPTVYGRILAALEQAARERWGAFDGAIMRVAGVYGPNRFGHGSHSSRLVERLLYSASQRRPIRIEGYPDDADDIIYVKDVGLSLARAATVPAVPEPVINVGAGRTHSLDDLLSGLRNLFGPLDAEVVPPAQPRKPIGRAPLAITRLEQWLGVRARPLASALRDFAGEVGMTIADPSPLAQDHWNEDADVE